MDGRRSERVMLDREVLDSWAPLSADDAGGRRTASSAGVTQNACTAGVSTSGDDSQVERAVAGRADCIAEPSARTNPASSSDVFTAATDKMLLFNEVFNGGRHTVAAWISSPVSLGAQSDGDTETGAVELLNGE